METNKPISMVIMRSNPDMEERYDFKKEWRVTEIFLLHVKGGYQCDKAVNKNDTREVI